MPDVDINDIGRTDIAGAGLIAIAFGPKRLRWGHNISQAALIDRVFMAKSADSALKLGLAHGVVVCAAVGRGYKLEVPVATRCDLPDAGGEAVS